MAPMKFRSIFQDVEDSEKTSVVVGPAGGLVQVGMCYIQVPEGALDDDVSMTLTLNYERNSRTVGSECDL